MGKKALERSAHQPGSPGGGGEVRGETPIQPVPTPADIPKSDPPIAREVLTPDLKTKVSRLRQISKKLDAHSLDQLLRIAEILAEK